MKQILIIEDDKNIADLQKDYLEINGYEATVEHNGKAGYELAMKGDYNLIIVDIMLPDMEGFEIIKSVRLEKDLPIIVVSARDEDIDKVRGLGLGANDYMTKPFSPAELLARIKTHITYYEKLAGISHKKTDYAFKGLEIDDASRTVKVNGKVIKLPTKEYELLWYLATHPNKVHTKEALFDKIWGMDPVGDMATVSVHIQRIRKKLRKTLPSQST